MGIVCFAGNTPPVCCRPEGKGVNLAAAQRQRDAERGRLALRKLRQERRLADLTAELKLAVRGNTSVPAGQHTIQRPSGRTAIPSLYACQDHSSNCRMDGPTGVISGASAMQSTKEMQSPGMLSSCAGGCRSVGGRLKQLSSETAGASVVQQDPVQRTAHVQWKLKHWRPQASEHVSSSRRVEEVHQRLWPGMNCECSCDINEVPRGACPVLPHTYRPHTEE